jgi:ABC-2 type transport system permease protein
VVALLFRVRPPASPAAGGLFLVSAVLSFFLVAGLNFLVGLIAIGTKSILGILRAKYLVLELLSGLLIPTTLFPEPLKSVLLASPFPHINFTPATLYLGKATGSGAAGLLLAQAGWTVALLALGQWAWRRSRHRITIQGG